MSLELMHRDVVAARTRTRAALSVSLVVHALVMTWLVFFQHAAEETTAITEVTWLEPKDLEPPKPAPVPAVPKPVAPAPVPAPRVTAAAPKPAVRPTAPAAQPAPPRPVPQGNTTVHEAPGASGIAARGAAPAGGGEKGRAAGARAAHDVQQATSSIDNMLSSLSGTLPPAAAHGDGGGARTEARYTVAGGRGAGQLPSVDGALRGTGLGEVGAGAGAGGGSGSGRGVQKAGVAIVDKGVESAGDGAAASGRDSRSLMATVQRYVAGIKFCYDNALKKAPQLQGKITLQMDIAASGEVLNLQPVDDGMGNAALQRCILSQVQSWHFPAIEAGTVRFTLPLVFTPPQGVTP